MIAIPILDLSVCDIWVDSPLSVIDDNVDGAVSEEALVESTKVESWDTEVAIGLAVVSDIELV